MTRAAMENDKLAKNLYSEVAKPKDQASLNLPVERIQTAAELLSSYENSK